MVEISKLLYSQNVLLDLSEKQESKHGDVNAVDYRHFVNHMPSSDNVVWDTDPSKGADYRNFVNSFPSSADVVWDDDVAGNQLSSAHDQDVLIYLYISIRSL